MKLVKLLSVFFLFLFIVNVNAAIAQTGGTDSRPEDVLRSEETRFFEHGDNRVTQAQHCKMGCANPFQLALSAVFR